MEISALKETGIDEAAEEAIRSASEDKTVPLHIFSGPVEHALAHIEEAIVHDLPEEQQRWYAIKIFERDEKVLEKMQIPADKMEHIEKDIQAAEKELDDDSESIIINDRYNFIEGVIKGTYKKKSQGKATVSDKIDSIVTNRILGLPIFAAIMFLIYYISMVTIGAAATDWANNCLFGDGFHLFGIGSSAYEEASGDYTAAYNAVDAFLGMNEDTDLNSIREFTTEEESVSYTLEDEETLEDYQVDVYYEKVPEKAEASKVNPMSYQDAVLYFEKNGMDEPDPASYGMWVPGVPVWAERGLDRIGCADWVKSLVLDGIITGVGSVLGFVPQMLMRIYGPCCFCPRPYLQEDRSFR